MNIVCLGCSYTAGMPDNYYSWPEKLANLRPSDTIYNLAVSGTSLLFSIYILKQIQKIINVDKTIFQITNPHRQTSFEKIRIEDSFIQNKNYIRIDPDIRKKQKILTITPATTKGKWTENKEKIKWSLNFYKNYSKDLGLLQHNILDNYIKNVATFTFTYSEIPEYAQNNIIDSSGHFNNIGHNIIADWINNELERNIH